ncbi:MAG TPA: serine/threonine-protein kinase [Vicinamibacterales bacterium]|nr:serine/threonine-protein kinase [Vicinamibacterales bacterium]
MIGRIFGPYRVVERLGSGGMGSVYRAVADAEPDQPREVALKILDAPTADAQARLRAESGALARVNHAGVASVYELIEEDGCLALAMELVRGQTWQEVLEHGTIFSAGQAVELCGQLLAALEHVHAAGVVHRDLKPANVMLTDSGAVKITDFGIARVDDAVNLTAAGRMIGTPAFMAPEQVLGHPVDARADLYAIGVLLFRLVTGDLPFKGSTPFEMAQAQVNDAPRRAREARPDLPEWVDEILNRALAKRPGHRFQSAAEFREALGAAVRTDQDGISVVERTEAMVRPVIAEAAVPAAAPAQPPAPLRPPHVWQAAGLTIAVAAAAWMFVSFGSGAAPNPPAVSLPQGSASSFMSARLPPGSPDAPSAPAVPVAVSAKAARGPASVRPVRLAAAAASPVLSHPTVSFEHIKWLTVTGTRTAAADVMVQFSDAGVVVQTARGATAIMPYQRIAKATYARARDPQWDPALSRPAGKIDVPGVFGRDRDWLVLQSVDAYLVLRLDGADRDEVMRAFEARAGLAIERSPLRKPDRDQAGRPNRKP